jgi:hypothetical protein
MVSEHFSTLERLLRSIHHVVVNEASEGDLRNYMKCTSTLRHSPWLTNPTLCQWHTPPELEVILKDWLIICFAVEIQTWHTNSRDTIYVTPHDSRIRPEFWIENNVSETGPVSEMLRFLILRIPDDGRSPGTQQFWVLYTILRIWLES